LNRQYAINRMKLFGASKRKRVMIIGLFAPLLLGLASFLFGQFGYTSVCTKCGAQLHATDYHLPILDIIIFSRSRVEATPLSTALASINPTKECQHQWLFAAGGGNGVKCAIGSGRHLWTTIRSTNITALLVWNQKYGDSQFQHRLVHVAWDPETHGIADMMSFMIPDAGFTSAAEYKAWLDEHKLFFNDEVARHKESRMH